MNADLLANELFSELPSGFKGELPRPYAERLARLEGWAKLNALGLAGLTVSTTAIALNLVGWW